MLPWPRPAKRSARIHPQPQTTQACHANPDALAGGRSQRGQPAAAVSCDGSARLTDDSRPLVPHLCEHGHRSFMRSEERWAAATFAGIQPVGRSLWEGRQCPVCGSTVLRRVSLGRALALLLDALLAACPPQECAVRSAMLLSLWAEEHLPRTHRKTPQSAERQAQHGGGAQPLL